MSKMLDFGLFDLEIGDGLEQIIRPILGIYDIF